MQEKDGGHGVCRLADCPRSPQRCHLLFVYTLEEDEERCAAVAKVAETPKTDQNEKKEWDGKAGETRKLNQSE